MRIARRLLAVVVSLLVALVAAEALFRVVDPYGVSYYGEVQRYLRDAIEEAPGEFHAEGRIFQNRPDVDLELRRFRYRTDGRRLRRGAAEPGEGAGALRILFLGDSVTLAWGVDDEESWVRRIESAGTAADGRPLVCMNAGHLMYDTVQEAALLRAWGPALAPDVVVLCFVFNDVQPTWDQLQEMTAGAPDESGLRWRGSFLEGLLSATNAVLRYRRDARRLAEADRSTLPPFSFYPDGWPRCASALDDVAAACAELGARLVIFDHTEPPIPELAAWCDAGGVPRVATFFSPAEREQDIHNSAVDAHANALGNRLIADKALAGLRRLEILE